MTYLIGSRLGWEAEVRFLGDLAGGAFVLDALEPRDALRMAELVARYHDLPLGAVDASVIATAERLDVTAIATTDHRHFNVVRPEHAKRFELWP